MLRKFIEHNKISILVILMISILFTVVVHYGVDEVYKKQQDAQQQNIDTQLNFSKELVSHLFSEYESDLYLLRDFPLLNKYIDSDFKSVIYENDIETNLLNFANANRHYCYIRIINSSGNEIFKTTNNLNNNIIISPKSYLKNIKNLYYFQETIKLKKGKTFVSLIDLDEEYIHNKNLFIPVIRLATPIFDSKNIKKGIIVINIFISHIINNLPKNMFIQTPENKIITLKEDKSIYFETSNYNFTRPAGKLIISKTDTINYTNIEFLPGQMLFLGINNDTHFLKLELMKQSLIGFLLFLLFLCLVFAIGYINHIIYNRFIDVQKGIIFSLARLAEGRDPETGHHLERTRSYCVVLAKELRKNSKYTKIINDNFIENIYDAAPLHDIGKVGIRDSILLKDDKLSPEEFEIMKKHVLIGKAVLQNVIEKFKLKDSIFTMGRNICAYHHEKYNGEGYFENLSGNKICLEARIFAVCDAYDVIRSKRPYKEPLPHNEAIKRITVDRGEHFDPDIVDAFLNCEKEFLTICENFIK
ncbi:HD domain-containing protein [Candidatus Poribacteria bacterium]|nr:HD domain-containing protein [Candidatus Poribacteria bacterium]